MNYATGHALNISEIFSTFNVRKLKVSPKACEELIGERHKEKLAQKIFKHSIDLVLNDIIDNNATFNLPTASRKAEMRMKRFDKEVFAKARRHGKWKDVDFLASNFSAHQIIFNFQSKGVMREKLVYLNSTHRDRITEHTNNQKQYY